MKDRTPRSAAIWLLLTALIIGAFASLGSQPASAAANTAPRANDDTAVVHQQGVANVNVLRNDRDFDGDRLYVVRVIPSDDACGSFSHDTFYVTYVPGDCAPGRQHATVVINDRLNPDAGLRDRSELVVTVEQNRAVTARPSETESSRVLFTNNDADHPVRCRIERGGEVIQARYIGPGATVDVWSPDNKMPYKCWYADGAPAGEDVVAVTQLRPGAFLVDHPKRRQITLGCNGERSNIDAVCRIEGPRGWSRTLRAPAGQLVRRDYSFYVKGGRYNAYVQHLNRMWEKKDTEVAG